MKWTRGTRSGDVIDARGRRVSRRGMAIGGGAGVVVVIIVLIAQALGVDVRNVTGNEPSSGARRDQQQPQDQPPDPRTDPDAELVDFVNFVVPDIQDQFGKLVAAQDPFGGKAYRRAKFVIFTEAVETRCGVTDSAVGPFYCPPDEQAFIDLSFYRALRQRLGAPGDFAQAYVLAHELGHHMQQVMGIFDQVERRAGRSGKARNELSVRQELQADCFAGVWAHTARARNLLEIGDVDEALGAASAIGDDRLQNMAGRKVNPETWTHGSSEQRVRWFRRGLDSGRLAACDTFAARSI